MTDLTTGKSEKMLDISLVDKDIEQLAAVLNQYNEKQRQSIASILRHEMYLKESIANISHDLRTPLTVILGHLQLLKKENLSAGQTQRIETIFNKAERMKELIQTFYDLSVIDAKEVTPVREDFNLTNLLINLITENAPALEAKGISPVIGLPDHSVYLHSDYGMVERIFQNLIINAIRYSSGSIKIDLKQGKEKSAIFIIENPIDSSAIQFPLFRPAPCALGALLSAQLSRPRRKFQSRGNLQLSPYSITRLHCIVHSISMECCYM